uniref:Partial AB-hydrolase lipase domain-containing protein n=1 Tax=Malurus cyaneus samueli TaxID=2593467 RepID=A0A8C5TBM2_9PASS
MQLPDLVFSRLYELITYKGYPSEEYEVMTEDGYTITINRIPHGTQDQESPGSRPVVFLQHGLLGDASNWVTNMPNNSLGFLLADAGFDVWMGNSRGNRWSRKHQEYSIDQDEFWAFSFDEMAKFDLPAAINFILEKTGQEKLYYIGYSQGTTTAFIAFSTMPELAQKIKLYFALAPVTAIKYAKGPATKLLYLPEKVLRGMLGKREFLPKTECLTRIIAPVCSHRAFARLCRSVFFNLGGCNLKNIDNRINVYIAQTSAGTSVQNIIHWSQFALLPWTFISVLLHVFQTIPPLYNVEEMTVPTAVWTGGQDLLADPKDAAILLSKIKKLIYHKNIPEWAHLDFIWGLDAPLQVYNEIIDLMKKYP